jgi:hypothetical protein
MVCSRGKSWYLQDPRDSKAVCQNNGSWTLWSRRIRRVCLLFSEGKKVCTSCFIGFPLLFVISVLSFSLDVIRGFC